MNRWVRAVAALLLFTAFGIGKPHVLRFADGRDLATLNPWYGNSLNLIVLSELTMAHFTRRDRSGRLTPELVTEVPSRVNGSISLDGKSVTWHLRRGVRWSDGAPFDARDVVFTIAAAKNRQNSFLDRPFMDDVARVRAPDPYTVVIGLRRARGTIDRLFNTYGPACILPRHLLAHVPSLDRAPYNALPVGIGPFRYVRFDRGATVAMEANPYYFRGLPKLEHIEYKIITDDNTVLTQLRSEELDLWEDPGDFADRVARLPGIVTVRQPGIFFRVMVFNVRRPLVADRRVRTALGLALHRRDFLAKIAHGYGTVTDAFVAPAFSKSGGSSRVAPYDAAAARRLLDGAGWRIGPDGVRMKGADRLRLRLVAKSGEPSVSTSIELLRAYWRSIGVELETQFFAPLEFFAPASRGGPLMNGAFDAALYSAAFNDDAILRDFFGCQQAAPHGFNVARYCSPSVDRDIAAAAEVADAGKRRRILRRIQETIAADAPAIILYRLDDVVAFASRITGYHPTLITYMDDMMNVDSR